MTMDVPATTTGKECMTASVIMIESDTMIG